ncbi:protein ERGIC-53-like isoform X1 [Neofelis nebulosa]|uniref:protein ERGIC-53-like isoform X1 n=2 Tax=Neofelis nebulosa TaxID=61452 RepID=UPI00272A51C0|nr:protein ERGIC-53-like isoform X1 [Neofelis nebulosa]
MGQSQVGDRSGVRLEMRKGLGLRSGLEGIGCLLGLKGERGVPTETSSSPPGPVPRAPPLASQLRLHSGAQTPVPFTMLVIRGPDPLFCLLLLLLVGPHNPVGASPPQRRFEYKLSFKGPRLALPGAGIPFWSHHGDAILGLEAVRLAPSMRNRSGAVWSRAPVPFSAWEVHVQMRVTGPGRRGAQGMAVWYTRGRGQVGSVLEGLASWDGIGILFDSSTEDTQNSPIIRVLASDAHTSYEPRGDAASGVLGSCHRDFRNLPNPLRVRITYWGQRLRVSLNSGLTPNDLDEVCVDVGPLLLAPGGFFGVSAATGTLADDHDILSFLTFSLSEPDPKPPPLPFLEMEQLRLVKQLEGLRARLALGTREDVIPKLSSEVQEEGFCQGQRPAPWTEDSAPGPARDEGSSCPRGLKSPALLSACGHQASFLRAGPDPGPPAEGPSGPTESGSQEPPPTWPTPRSLLVPAAQHLLVLPPHSDYRLLLLRALQAGAGQEPSGLFVHRQPSSVSCTTHSWGPGDSEEAASLLQHTRMTHLKALKESPQEVDGAQGVAGSGLQAGKDIKDWSDCQKTRYPTSLEPWTVDREGVTTVVILSPEQRVESPGAPLGPAQPASP